MDRRTTIEEESIQTKSKFLVLCIWCGAKIRSDPHKDSAGECLQCFYRILRERLLSQTRTAASEFVSDR